MTNYAPIVEQIGWNNAYSIPFCDLLSVCAYGAPVPGLWRGHGVDLLDLRGQARRLLTRELIARINTGSLLHSPWYDPLIQSDSGRYGPRSADEFCLRASKAPYPAFTGGRVRFSLPVLRFGELDTPEVVQTTAIDQYQAELAAVLAARDKLMSDLARLQEANTAADPIAAAAIAADRATARASYVTQLQAEYPNRGYA